MTDALTNRLASTFDDYRVVRKLHEVPPHEVWVVEVAGRRAVCKFDTGPTGKAGVEGRVIAFVRARTSVPAPAVLGMGDDWFVAEWLPDAPDADGGRRVTAAWATAAGRGLATLHAETAPFLDEFGRFTPDSSADGLVVDGHEDWHAAACTMVRRYESMLGDVGHGDVATAVLEHLNEHQCAFDGTGGPVVCHGWWSPAHVATDDGGVTAVVDFEHAIAAPAEWDYWRTVLATVDDGPCQAAFREGYESVRALPAGVEERRPAFELLHALYFFESLYVQDQHDDAETANRATEFRERVFERLDDR